MQPVQQKSFAILKQFWRLSRLEVVCKTRYKCLMLTFQLICVTLQTSVVQHAAVNLSPYSNTAQLSNIYGAKMPRPSFAWDVWLSQIAFCINLSELWVSWHNIRLEILEKGDDAVPLAWDPLVNSINCAAAESMVWLRFRISSFKVGRRSLRNKVRIVI